MYLTVNSFSATNQYRKLLSQPYQKRTADISVSKAEKSYPLNVDFRAAAKINYKKINVILEKEKLLKQLNNILETDVPSMTTEDQINYLLRKYTYMIKAKRKRLSVIIESVDRIKNDKYLNNQQRVSALNALKKEVKSIDKPIQKIKIPVIKSSDEEIDYTLINLFKSAILEDNFNLDTVLQNYYSGLNNIDTIEELKEKYPKIKIPQRPEEVIGKRIAQTFNRDFFIAVNEYLNSADTDSAKKYITERIKEILDNYNFDEKTYEKILDSACVASALRHYSIMKKQMLSAVPENKKFKGQLVSELDKKLLSIDYDKYVTYVIREQYLNSKKTNELQYREGKTVLNVGSVNIGEYKFEKFSEKVKSILAIAARLKTGQRDYEHFEIDEFKKRLDFYFNSEIGENEILFKKIAEFDSCNFEESDISNLILLLEEFDKFYDGKITLETVIKNIYDKKIRPAGTEEYNKIENEKANKIRKEQQKLAKELKLMQSEFDTAINKLYSSNKSKLANICAEYRPESLDIKEIENAKFIIKAIEEAYKSPEGLSNLNTKITRWEKYNEYKSQDSKLYQDALEYAVNHKGKAGIDDIGKYLYCAELYEFYPESLELTTNQNILEKVIKEYGSRRDIAIDLLCRYEDYKFLSQEKKSYMSDILNIFDRKNPAHKSILRIIVENDYVKNDTIFVRSDNVPVNFPSISKQAILEKHKFPNCIDYLCEFEDAIKYFASTKGSSGVKKLSRNNKAIEHKMEVKIDGYPDRLFSSKNNFVFDLYSDTGYH